MVERKCKDWMGSWVEYCHGWMESPSIFMQWTAASTIASALERKCWHTWDTKIYANMYIILVGPPGARKGTAMGPALRMLREREEGTNEALLGVNLAAESITRQALIRKIKDGVQSYTIDGQEVRHCSMTIFNEELSVFLNGEDEHLPQHLANWYDCRDVWEYVTKTSGEDYIEGMWVNMIGATTPDHIFRMPGDVVSGGLASRIIFIYAERKSKLIPLPKQDPNSRSIYDDLLHDLQLINQMKGEFQFRPSFLKKYEPWYMEQQNEDVLTDRRFEGYMDRRSLHLRKLAMISSASRSSSMIIDGLDFDRALGMLEEAEAEMPRVFSGFGELDNSHLVPRMCAIVQQRKQMTWEELFYFFHKDLTNKQFDEMLVSLCAVTPPYLYLKSEPFNKEEPNGKQRTIISYARETGSRMGDMGRDFFNKNTEQGDQA